MIINDNSIHEQVQPYWMVMPGRNGSAGDQYRYGFQGQEMDDEVKGDGNSINYKYRMHDPRVGRFFAVDPLAPKYPHNSPYAFSENSTIAFVELEGLEKYYASNGAYLGKFGKDNTVRVVRDAEVAMATQELKKYMKAPEEYLKTKDAGYLKNYLSASIGSETLEEFITEVSDVTNGAALETFSMHGDCRAAANAQMKKAKLEPEGSASAIQMFNPNSKSENRIGGIIYAVNELKKGNPLEVGIIGMTADGLYGPVEPPNANRYTTHFLVLNSIKINNGIVQIEYLDNAQSATGRNENENLFSVDLNQGTMIDNTRTPMGNDQYQVTEIRKSKPILDGPAGLPSTLMNHIMDRIKF